MPDPQQHGEHRNLVESVLRYIPGFHGYLEKEYRRESDQLARTWLVDQVQCGKRGLDDFTRTLTDAGRLDELTLCERFRTRLDDRRELKARPFDLRREFLLPVGTTPHRRYHAHRDDRPNCTLD